MKGLLREMPWLAVLVLCGCATEPVEWGDISYRGTKLGDPDARSAIFSAGLPSLDGESACLRSIRTARSGSDLFRVWWTARPDSSVVLRLQRSATSGVSWLPATTVETRDRGRRGCDRPAPGVYLDSASNYLHIVYYIEASDGAGVFFSHSMDKGATFHAPVPVVYGKRPAAASVAAQGDSVVVVFEDPNVVEPRVGIALSRTAGHIFEQRAQVTPDDVAGSAPWVKLDRREITVWWKSSERVGSRVGRWR